MGCDLGEENSGTERRNVETCFLMPWCFFSPFVGQRPTKIFPGEVLSSKESWNNHGLQGGPPNRS